MNFDFLQELEAPSIAEEFGIKATADDDNVQDDNPPIESELLIEGADVVNNPYLTDDGFAKTFPPDSTLSLEQELSALRQTPDDGVDPANFEGFVEASLSGESDSPTAKVKKSSNIFDSKATTLEAFKQELDDLTRSGSVIPVQLSVLSSNTEPLRKGMKRVVGDMRRQRNFVPKIESGEIFKDGSTWCVNSDNVPLLLDIFNYFAEDKTGTATSKRAAKSSSGSKNVGNHTECEDVPQRKYLFPQVESQIEYDVDALDPNYLESSSGEPTVAYPDQSFPEMTPLQNQLNSDDLDGLI